MFSDTQKSDGSDFKKTDPKKLTGQFFGYTLVVLLTLRANFMSGNRVESSVAVNDGDNIITKKMKK